MTRVLLFCIAEEAKPFVRKTLDVTNNVTSIPTFETDFIGASKHDCQKWALEKQFQVNFVEQDIIAIADMRSVRDDTLLIKYYARELDPPEPALEFGEFGVLPRKRNTWYDFRIDYKGATSVEIDLTNGLIDTVYPTYFGRKEELTDERGVFNVAKANRFVRGEDPDTSHT